MNGRINLNVGANLNVSPFKISNVLDLEFYN